MTQFIVMTVFLLSCFQDFAGAVNAGITHLMIASAKGDTERVETLLASNPTQEYVMQADKAGNTALMHASPYDKYLEGRYVPVVKLLLDRMDKKHLLATNKKGETALILAADTGNKAIVDLLLEKNHDEEHLVAEDNRGHSALAWAVRRGYQAVVAMLLSYHPKEQLQSSAFENCSQKEIKNPKPDSSKLPLKFVLEAVWKQLFGIAGALLDEDSSLSKLCRTKIPAFHSRLSKLFRTKMKIPAFSKLRLTKKPMLKWLIKLRNDYHLSA